MLVDGLELTPVPGFGGHILITRCGKLYSSKSNKWLSQHPNADGYLKVSIRIGSSTRNFFVHRLVLLTFKGECPSGMESNHRDTNRQNNHVDNLEWITHRENLIHALNNGSFPARGQQSGRVKFSDREVELIRRAKQIGFSVQLISELFEASEIQVRRIINHQSRAV